MLQYRVTPHSTTGKSPAELLFNRKLTTVLDRVHPFFNKKVRNSQVKMKSYHDRSRRQRELKVSEMVKPKNFTAGPNWSGSVLCKTGPVSYEVRLDDGRIIRRHVDHLYSCHKHVDAEAESVAEEPLTSEIPSYVPQIGVPEGISQEGREIKITPGHDKTDNSMAKLESTHVETEVQSVQGEPSTSVELSSVSRNRQTAERKSCED